MELVRLRESSERQVLDRRDPTRPFRSDFLKICTLTPKIKSPRAFPTDRELTQR